MAGLPWPQALEEGLRDVRAVAVFIGRELGGWQKREMWFALDRQVREEKQGRAFPVIPVLLPRADLMPGFLFTNTWIDLRSGFEGAAAAEALDAFELIINSTQPAQAPQHPTGICPYRGLQVFREEHAAFFFGRKAFADQLLDFTLGKDLVAVVGPSGSGKSSVVHAGLLPLLRRAQPPRTTWDVVSFTPGNDPFHRLASALIPLLEPDKDEVARLAEAEGLGANLAGAKTRIEAIVSRVIEKSNGTGRLLLVADQFEELFTLTPEPSRRPFAQALLRALGNAPFTLLLTLRADFYSQVITLDRELSDRLAPAQVNIGALTPDELRECVAAPARLVGLEFEPGLVERILTDVGSEPGRLPLLEFALTELWQCREGGRLANRAYDGIGGAAGALAQRAEAEFARLKPEEQTAARRLFSRLVRVARPEEAGEDTRQRADLSDADTVPKRVAKSLADARLLVTGGDPGKGTFSVEVAHEALIRNWERLRVWLNEDREFLLWRQRLQVQVAEWQAQKQDAGYLLRGTPLSEADRWLLGRPQDLTDAEQQLIRASIALRERERQDEEKRRQAEVENARRLKDAAEARAEAERELTEKARALAKEQAERAEVERQRAEEQARLARRFRWLAAGLAAMLLLVIATTLWAFWQRNEAQAQRHRAEDLRVVSAGQVLAFQAPREQQRGDSDLAVLLARQAFLFDLRRPGRPTNVVDHALHEALAGPDFSHILSGHVGMVFSVAFSPDGTRLASGAEDQTVRVWDLVRPQAPPLVLTGDWGGQVTSVAFSPNGRRLASGCEDGTVRVWDLRERQEAPLTLTGHKERVTSIAFSSDGQRLASGSYDDTVKVWDLRQPQAVPLTLPRPPVGPPRTGPQEGILAVAFGLDGQRVAAVSWDNRVRLWDLHHPQTAPLVITWAPAGRNQLFSLAFSPDGQMLAAGGEDQAVRVWDLRHPQAVPLVLMGHQESVFSVAFSKDGHRLASGSADATVRVWDMRQPQAAPLVLICPDCQSEDPLNSDSVYSVAFSPDGNWLASGSQKGKVRLWPLSEVLAERACQVVWRNLAMAEWQQFVGEDISYERTCPNLPTGEGAPPNSPAARPTH